MTPPTLSHWSAQINKWTFTNTKIRAWTESRLHGRVLNACCGLCILDHSGEVVRNDVQSEITLDNSVTVNGVDYEKGDTVSTNADLHSPVGALDSTVSENSFDTIVYDPPFSDNQAEESYGLTTVGAETETGSARPVVETLDYILKPGGTIIFFGFGSSLMPDTYGYSMSDIAHWNIFGDMFDWFSSVCRKPSHATQIQQSQSPTPSPGDLLVSVSDNVVPNANIDQYPNATGTSSGNSGNPITVRYDRFAENTDLKQKMDAIVSDIDTGCTLSLSRGQTVISPTDTQTVWNALNNCPEADAHVSPHRLSDEYASEFFDTVIVNPGPAGYQRNLSYYGGHKHEHTILKYESHPLVRPDGRIIQLGHTATCMNGSLPYNREHIHILSAADSPRDYIITIDAKSLDESPSEGAEPPERGIDSVRDYMTTATEPHTSNCHVCGSEATCGGQCAQCGTALTTGDFCDTCGAASYHDLVWYVDCLECGACPNNYCIDQNTGAVLTEPHQDRIREVTRKHRNCSQPTDAQASTKRVPPVDLVETPDSSSQFTIQGF